MQDLGIYTQLLNHHDHHHFSPFSRIWIILEVNLLQLLKKRYCIQTYIWHCNKTTEHADHIILTSAEVICLPQSLIPPICVSSTANKLVRYPELTDANQHCHCYQTRWSTSQMMAGNMMNAAAHPAPAHPISYVPSKGAVMAHCPFWV